MMRARAEIASRLINGLWSLSANRAETAFRRALERPRETQEQLLAGILERNASTRYGRDYSFSRIRSMAEYRERVPLSTYDDYAGHVARIRRGEPDVLTREPVTRLVPSSGSVGARKLIPYTRSLHREFQEGILPWIAGLFRGQPEIGWGPAYWSISPSIPEIEVAGEIPIGFEDDAYYLSDSMRRLVRHVQAVPPGVRHVCDIGTFRIVTLLFLLRARQLRLISVWHPSFLALLCREMTEQFERLLRLIADGYFTIELSPDENAILATKDRTLAAELERLDPRRPETIWPRLRQISCWADGQAAGAARDLAAWFPNVELAPKGLIATEAFVSLPFEGARPLAVRSHVLEFLDPIGNVFGVDDLTLGMEYSVVVTTSGGLYRYRLNDRVRVDGFVRRTPSIVFVGKEDHVSDLVGEKLDEGFVASVLARVFHDAGAQPEFALLAPERTEHGHRYTLFVESRGGAMPRALGAEVERELCANPHYELARRLGQLEPLAVCPVGAAAHEVFLSHRSQSGTVLGNVKPSCLSTDTGWRSRFAPQPPET
ncbi:MAG: GH3 auxin-responsive promoter family protein [Thermoanaerobaculia bacterium]|nr:GH3 auxin-responsive promoter family protein [Thermoanaerobaculia bacterium]